MQISSADLQRACELLNAAYRAGAPLVEDAVYDHVFIRALKATDPSNEFLNSVEPEGEVFNAPTVRHTSPMLSTDKAYSKEDVERFIKRLIEAGKDLGVEPGQVIVRVTPKLDGIACSDYGDKMVTRGDGIAGSDITRILDRGAVIAGGVRGKGPGEIVAVQSYFEAVLKPRFGMEHPRNYITGFCGADTVKDHHREAAAAKAVVFVPYTTLEAWSGTAAEFLAQWQTICAGLKDSVPYLTDGAVVEAVSPDIKAVLGATSSHHRWMLAIKEKGEIAQTKALGITWQTGRTGRVTPVVELEPIYLSGATISRVTAHHAGMVKELGIGIGAVLEIIRSGEVIPKIERVVERVEAVVPEACPCCSHSLAWEGDFLVCPNSLGCSEQVATSLIHFFKTLGNVDLFGPKAVQLLVADGKSTLLDIYRMTAPDFEAVGFGPGQAANLVRELQRSRLQEVEDWRFLAAFGLRYLGRGDARKLLIGFTLDQLLDGVSADDIQKLEGFGELTSSSIAAALSEQAEVIREMSGLFNLRATGAAVPSETPQDSALSGRKIVFTGSLRSGSREELQERARALGADVQSSVNSKTDMLICGDKVGASKTAKAASLGVKVITEDQYLVLISSSNQVS